MNASTDEETAAPPYTYPQEAYEHISYWLVFCGAGCGSWLSGSPNAWSSTRDKRRAARHDTKNQAWQGAMAAGWANTPLPDHAPHEHGPYGPDGHWFQCVNTGAGDCGAARSYRDATVCPECRRKGWRP